MPAQKLTQKWIEAEVAKKRTCRTDYFDTAHHGLCLRIGPRSASWYYMTRVNGRLVRLKLGDWPSTGIADARARSAQVEQQKAEGLHPKAEQARVQSTLRAARELDGTRIVRTISALWAASHFRELAPATRTDYQRALSELIAEFGDEDIGALRRGELIRFLDKIKSRSTSAANRMAVVIRLLFSFARDRLDLEANPAADIKNEPPRLSRRLLTLRGWSHEQSKQVFP